MLNFLEEIVGEEESAETEMFVRRFIEKLKLRPSSKRKRGFGEVDRKRDKNMSLAKLLVLSSEPRERMYSFLTILPDMFLFYYKVCFILFSLESSPHY